MRFTSKIQENGFDAQVEPRGCGSRLRLRLRLGLRLGLRLNLTIVVNFDLLSPLLLEEEEGEVDLEMRGGGARCCFPGKSKRGTFIWKIVSVSIGFGFTCGRGIALCCMAVKVATAAHAMFY